MGIEFGRDDLLDIGEDESRRRCIRRRRDYKDDGIAAKGAADMERRELAVDGEAAFAGVPAEVAGVERERCYDLALARIERARGALPGVRVGAAGAGVERSGRCEHAQEKDQNKANLKSHRVLSCHVERP